MSAGCSCTAALATRACELRDAPASKICVGPLQLMPIFGHSRSEKPHSTCLRDAAGQLRA